MASACFIGPGPCSTWVFAISALLMYAACAGQELDVSSAREDKEPLHVSSVRADKEPLYVSSVRADKEPLYVSSVRADKEPPAALHCRHEQCLYLGYNVTDNIKDTYYYEIEGNTIQISTMKSGYETQFQITDLWVKCHGAKVLESLALPSFQPAYHIIRGVQLVDCPLPAAGSLRDTFAAFNVSLCEQGYHDEPCQLWLLDPPATTTLRAEHVLGFERLQVMVIVLRKMRASAERDFLVSLRSLRRLTLRGVTLPAGALDALPPSLSALVLTNTSLERLPEVIHSLPNLQTLQVVNDIPLDAGGVPPGVQRLELVSPATTLRLDVAPLLETFSMENWVEPLPPPVSRCAALRKLNLLAPTMRALPDKWLWNCSRLEELEVLEARHLLTLPPTLFSRGTPLQLLAFRRGALETLPAGLLQDVRSLITLQLNNNRITMLPRHFFVKYFFQLSKLDLSSNDLDEDVFNTLRDLNAVFRPSLTELNLARNPRIGDVCRANGSSVLWRQRYLIKLDLSNTGISRICKDWRYMLRLQLLDLRGTNISELSFADLQYNRTVRSEVRLQGAPLTALRVTREDYNKALRAEPSFTSVQLDAELECDCRLYWARRVLGHPRALLALPGVRNLRCIGGGLLRDSPAEKLECGAREECVAAEMPAGCACAARPDDDPSQDRWLVRVRCDNGSLGFVQRRTYPFYPLESSKNQGVYLTKTIGTLN